ncbi:MAG: DUF3883 domain-containing protein [Terracidiphilus sp.]|nr:DUF3883 domain-containing protein [Terracidiphilus sp.]
MIANSSLQLDKLTTRQKLILSGLYLSKFDEVGLNRLGFDSFREAFNLIGYALGSRPASIKNYRDEFDPLLSKKRKGWHKRPMREYCREIFSQFKELDIDSFTGLVKSFVGSDANILSEIEPIDHPEKSESSFAQRLMTGLAAEQYFESIHNKIPEFNGYLLENTTRFGCGYDFRLRLESERNDFLAVEVKGLRDDSGSLSMTPKEYRVASELRERFFLVVVKNFRETPSHSIFQDPLSSGLLFKRVERTLIQTSWMTSI